MLALRCDRRCERWGATDGGRGGGVVRAVRREEREGKEMRELEREGADEVLGREAVEGR